MSILLAGDRETFFKIRYFPFKFQRKAILQALDRLHLRIRDPPIITVTRDCHCCIEASRVRSIDSYPVLGDPYIKCQFDHSTHTAPLSKRQCNDKKCMKKAEQFE
jgi:hypothetical protein